MLNRTTVAIACHDAGGTEILAAMVVAEQDRYQFRLLARENTPAWRIFKRRGLSSFVVPVNPGQDCSLLLAGCDLLICGTGTNDYEWAFLAAARLQGTPSISVLDHWVNYRERFGYPDSGWKRNLPNYIGVTDDHAFETARELGLGQLIRLRNYYLLELIESYQGCIADSRGGDELLYISESVEEHYGSDTTAPAHPGYTQSDVLSDLLECVPRLAEGIGLQRLTVRLHPAEPPDKYDEIIENGSALPIVIQRPDEVPLGEGIARAQLVVGISSMALLIACLVGKPSVSIIPSGDQCDLPLPAACCLTSSAQIDADIERYAVTNSREPDFFAEFDLSRVFSQLEVVS